MNISPVSFRNTVTNAQKVDIDSLIRQPQTYTMKEPPAAAAEIKGSEKKKSPFKTILGIAAGAAGVATALAVCAKFGIFDAKVNGNKYVEMAKSGLKLAGEKIASFANSAVSFVQTKFSEIKNNIPKGAEELAEEVVETAAEAIS